MRNRIAASLLMAILCCGLCPGITAEPLMLDECFNGCATNAIPGTITFKGSDNARVLPDGADNKAFFMPTNKPNVISAGLGAVEEIYTVSFKLKFIGKQTAGQVILENGSSAITAFTIDEGGGLATKDKRKITSLNTDRYHKIEIICNEKIGRYSVRIDGREQLSDWKYSASGHFSAVKISFRRNADSTAGIYLDDMYTHNGTLMLDAVQCAFNTETVEFEEHNETAEVGNKVFYTQDFESASALGKLGAQINSNKLYIRKSNGSNALVMEKTGTTAIYFDTKLSAGTAKHIVFEADFCMAKPGMIANLFRLRDKSNLWNDLIFIGTGGELTLGATGSTDKVYQLKTGEWFNLALAVNFEGYTYDVYLNGKRISQNVPFVNNDFGDFAYTRNYIRENTAQGMLEIDNIKIYEGLEKRGNLSAAGSGAKYLTENTAFGLEDEEYIDELMQYSGFKRPSPSELAERMTASGSAGVHPRIMATAQTFEDIKNAYRSGNLRIMKMTENLLAQAEGYMKGQTVTYKINSSGNILDCARKLSKVIPTCAMAYRLTGREEYAQWVWREIENIKKTYPDWHPAHFLDTAEICAAVGIGYDWCYDHLTESQRRDCENLIVDFALAEGRQYYEGTPPSNAVSIWIKRHMNWSMVCNGGLAVGAMAIADARPEEAFYTISTALRSMEYGLAAFAPEGGWEEGPGYWAYSVQYLAYMLGSLDNTFGDNFGIRNSPGLSNTALAFVSMDGNTGNNNYHDDAGDGKGSSPYMFFFGNYYKDDEDAAIAQKAKAITAARLYGIRKYKIVTDWKDLLWYDTSVTSDKIELPLDTEVRNTEAAAMRSSWEDFDGIYLGFHAGRTKINDSNHGHYDTGTFVLDNLGERWAVDLGPDSYNLPRYMGNPEYYRVSAQGHNTIIIDPTETNYMHDMDAYCAIEKSESKDRGGYKIIDMTSLFKSKNKVESAKRGFMLTDDRSTVIVRDELKLTKKGEIYWLMHTPAEVTIAPDGRSAVLEINNKRMRLDLDCSVSGACFEKSEASPIEGTVNPDGQNKNEGITKLYVRLSASGDVNISVRMTKDGSDMAKEQFKCDSLERWSIPDGERCELPRANMIYIDGNVLGDFDPMHTEYTVMLPYCAEKQPKVSADAAYYEITEENGSAAVTVYDTSEKKTSRTYHIRFQKLFEPITINGMKAYALSGITASAEPETPAYFAADGDPGTKWAASGYSWMQLDIGTVAPVDAIAISYMKGNERIYRFAVEVSSDGKKFRRVLDAQTSGKTNEPEIFNFETASARYIRFIGFGNSYNEWNSVNEIAVFNMQ